VSGDGAVLIDTDLKKPESPGIAPGLFW